MLETGDSVSDMLTDAHELDLSLVMGCFNAGLSLDAKLRELIAYLDSLDRTYEVIVVDDGSEDGSPDALERLQACYPVLTVLCNPENRGKGYSIRRGVSQARGRSIIFTDIDLAYEPENLQTILGELERGRPIVVGNRRLPDSVYVVNNTLIRYVYRRHLIGKAFNVLVRRLFGLRIHDTQSGLKGFERQVASRVFANVYTDGFLFDIEIFIRAKRLGIPVLEIPVHVTYTSDDSTVSQMRSFFSLLPELSRIKTHDMRGGYAVETGQPETARVPELAGDRPAT
jgi:dolichyl-phosphate beta-glucosyltransferase